MTAVHRRECAWCRPLALHSSAGGYLCVYFTKDVGGLGESPWESDLQAWCEDWGEWGLVATFPQASGAARGRWALFLAFGCTTETRKGPIRPSPNRSSSLFGPDPSHPLPPPPWPLLPPCLPCSHLLPQPCLSAFFGSVSASLHPLAPFGLTEHPRHPCAACLLRDTVFPDSLFPTQAQGAQTQSESHVRTGQAGGRQEGHRV